MRQCGAGAVLRGTAQWRPLRESTLTRSDQNFIKRVVGLPGDRIAVRDGHVVRNGVEQREAFFATRGGGPDCNLGPITIPADQYFLMGDNRGASDDSRYWGPFPRDSIIGEVFLSYWPLDRIGFS